MAISCSRCIFVETLPPMSGGPFNYHQTGCAAGRLDLFKTQNKCRYVNGSGFYELSQFCNMYRGEEWMEDRLDEGFQNKQELAQAAKEENKIVFGFIIDHTEDLDKTMSSLLESNYDTSKLRIIFSLILEKSTTEDRRLVMDFVNELKKKDILANMIIHTTDDQITIDSRCFTPLLGEKCGYIAKIKSPRQIDTNYLDFINTQINDNVSQYTFFEDSNGVEMIHTGVINKTYLEFKDYDLMCGGLKDMSKKQGSYKQYDKKREIHNQPAD